FVVRINFAIAIAEPEDSPDSEAPDEETEEHPVTRITFELCALYEIDLEEDDEPVKEPELTAYARSSGMFTIYPYAREYVHDVTSRLGLPPLVMDVFKIPYPIPKEGKKRSPRRSSRLGI